MSQACSEQSQAAGEALAGTALEETTRWLLLELPGPWAAKPIMSPGIPDGLRAHLQAVLASVPGTRLQLLRGTGTGTGPLTLKVVRSGPTGAAVHTRTLQQLTDLTEVDIPALWEAPATTASDPLILVCAHGMRDRCCAKAGAPLAHALSALRPEAVWQTSHLGGHRFAATAVVLPWGVHLGRLTADEAEAVLEAVDAGRLHRLDRYRGCTAWPKTAQAAAIFLRAEADLMDLDAVAYLGGQPLDEGGVEERFQTPSGEARVVVQMGPAGPPRKKSCSAEMLSSAVPLQCRRAGQ